jgi:hypothetical protein
MLGLSPTPRPRKACSGSSSPSAREEWGRSCTGWRRPTSSNARSHGRRPVQGTRSAPGVNRLGSRSLGRSGGGYGATGEVSAGGPLRTCQRFTSFSGADTGQGALRDGLFKQAINDTVLRKIVHGNAAGEKKEAKKCGCWCWCLLWQWAY